jgi:hypothetical protein
MSQPDLRAMATRDWLKGCVAGAANAPDVTEQLHGMAVGIRDLELIARLEAHLGAKLRRLLTLLRQQWKATPAGHR